MIRALITGMAAATVVLGAACRPTPAMHRELQSALARDLEIDHFYTYAPKGVREEAVVTALRDAGLFVSERRFEFPEGGVGRYVHFDNAYLEVLFQDHDIAVTHADTRRRVAWEQSGTSPFGVAFHRQDYAQPWPDLGTRVDTVRWFGSDGRLLQEELRLLGSESDSLAPVLFVVPAAMSVAQPRENLGPEAEVRRRRERTHAAGQLQVAEVRLHLPADSRSAAVQRAAGVEGLSILSGDDQLMEVVLLAAAPPGPRDLRPLLPLKLTFRQR